MYVTGVTQARFEMLPNLSGLMIGPPPKRKMSSVKVIIPSSLDGFSSLNKNGVMTFPIPTKLNCAGFAKKLRQCCKVWFNVNFKKMLKNPPEIMVKTGVYSQKMSEAKAQWDELSVEEQELNAGKIDASTPTGLLFIFDKNTLEEQDWVKKMKGKDFFLECIKFVRFGNQGTAQNSPLAWTSIGFGLWTHLAPDIGLPLVMYAMDIMKTFGLEPGQPEHFPHIIYKPPGGKPLGTHHDQMSPRDLIENLRVHVESDDPSTSGWVRKHGCQMLAHLEGGRGTNDGATYTIGPMTPTKLYVCLQAFAGGRVTGIEPTAWVGQPRGKIDLDWEMHIEEFNLVLKEEKLEPVGKIPAAPGTDDSYVNDTGHVLLFPVGWPHGSFSNSNATGGGSRITVTMPITLANSNQRSIPETQDRLQNMALLATDGQSKEEYIAAEEWLQDKTRIVRPWLRDEITKSRWEAMGSGQKARVTREVKQYADGPAHASGYVVCDLIRCPDASNKMKKGTGPFYNICVKKETVKLYLEYLESSPGSGSSQRTTLARVCEDVYNSDSEEAPEEEGGSAIPMKDSMKMERPKGWHKPPNVNVLEGKVVLLKVKQPWATHLVTGLKDCENRSWCLKVDYPAWVVIVASRSKPERASLQDCVKRLKADHHPFGANRVGGPDEYDTGKMVGMVHILGCYASGSLPWQTVWHNKPDNAWMISDAWEFDDPIPLHKDDKFQTKVNLSSTETNGYGYKDLITTQINKLEEGFR